MGDSPGGDTPGGYLGGTPGGAERTASRVLRGPNKRNAAISSLVVGEVLEVRGST